MRQTRVYSTLVEDGAVPRAPSADRMARERASAAVSDDATADCGTVCMEGVCFCIAFM